MSQKSRLRDGRATACINAFLCLLASCLLLACHVAAESTEDCDGRRVFTHQLPEEFNEGLLYNESRKGTADPDHATYLSLANVQLGFGKQIQNVGNLPGLESVWFNSDPIALEVIFYHRIKSYTCRVDSLQESDLVYVPYFGTHNHQRTGSKPDEERDRLPQQLLTWLKAHPAWQRQQGRDHFLVLGSPIFDFLRFRPGGYGNRLLLLDGVKDNIMTVLTERGWQEPFVFSSPQPTGFHPVHRWQVEKWQQHVLSHGRSHLFSLASGHRESHLPEGMLREKLFWQCSQAGGEACGLLDCGKPGSNCKDMNSFFGLYLSSNFCLHPRGDSCTRRAVLDSALAGCIPVVFLECTLEIQFQWHMERHVGQGRRPYIYIPWQAVKGETRPEAGDSSTSAIGVAGDGGFSPDSVMVEEVLRKIPSEEVEEMRQKLVGLIPKLIYGGQAVGDAIRPPDFEDAFEVILKGLSRKVKSSA